MTSILERDSYDPRPIEFRRIAVAVLVLLVTGAAWYGIRDHLLYEATCRLLALAAYNRLANRRIGVCG